jgi:hypothetical protein
MNLSERTVAIMVIAMVIAGTLALYAGISYVQFIQTVNVAS